MLISGADLITVALNKKSSLPKSLENVVVLYLAKGCLQMSLIQRSQGEVILNNPGDLLQQPQETDTRDKRPEQAQ